MSYSNMTFEDVQNNVNQWVWDNDEKMYFWVLGTDPKTKTIDAKGVGGGETRLFFSLGRFFKHAQKI